MVCSPACTPALVVTALTVLPVALFAASQVCNMVAKHVLTLTSMGR